MKIKTSRNAGFTLVEIMIVVAIIGLLAAIAIPNFIKARNTSQTNACINNLRQIDAAKQEWALETGQTAAAIPTPASLASFLGRGTAGATINVAGGTVANDINCPAGGTYAILAINVAPTCTITGHVLTN
jgi:prepilin-type N-terminal cleavage/methylation domain-containing protein